MRSMLAEAGYIKRKTMNIRLSLGIASAAAALVAVSGCGGSPTLGTASNPRIRVVDALQTPATVNVTVDGGLITGVNTFQNVSNYQVFNNGNRTVIFTDASTGATLINQSSPYTLNSFYTAIGYQSASGPALMVLQDSDHLGSTQGSIRFVKAAAGSSASVDFYVIPAGNSLATQTPIYTAVTLGNVSQAYRSFTSGTYTVTETIAGTKTPIISQQITLSGGAATTLLDVGTSTFLTLQDQ
jgi:hypothetical protein